MKSAFLFWKPFTYKGRIYDENDLKKLQELDVVNCRGIYYEIVPAVNKCIGCKFNIDDREYVYANCLGTIEKWILSDEIGSCIADKFIFKELFVASLIKHDWKPDISIN